MVRSNGLPERVVILSRHRFPQAYVHELFSEPACYEKTILSDLQGAWECLWTTLTEQAGFEGWDKMLFHVDEAMSWETVRHLERMEPLRVLLRNLAMHARRQYPFPGD